MPVWAILRDGAVMIGLFVMAWALSILGHGYGL